MHRDRATATYCHTPRWSCVDFKRALQRTRADGESSQSAFIRLMERLQTDRYDALNLTAYYRHKTFEHRTLEGTIDAVTICNWIILNCRFIDAVKDMTIEDIDECFGSSLDGAFVEVARIVDDCHLVGWIRSRGWRTHQHPFPG